MTNTLLRLLAVAGAVMAASPAMADDFNFSFDGDTTIGNNLGGTISGTIFGLPTTGTARPTNVTVSYAGVSYTSSPFGVFGSGFTTLNGAVTGADYQTTLNPGPGNLNLGLFGFNQLITSNNQAVISRGGFSAIRFARVTPTSAVPEPASWVMLILGMGAVGFAMRRRKAISTRVAYA